MAADRLTDTSLWVVTGYNVLLMERCWVSKPTTKEKADAALERWRRTARRHRYVPYKALRVEPAEREGDIFTPPSVKGGILTTAKDKLLLQPKNGVLSVNMYQKYD